MRPYLETSSSRRSRSATARFPFVKPLETFDFGYQPSIDKKQVLSLATCHFIEHGDNVIVLGVAAGPRCRLARFWRRWRESRCG